MSLLYVNYLVLDKHIDTYETVCTCTNVQKYAHMHCFKQYNTVAYTN